MYKRFSLSLSSAPERKANESYKSVLVPGKAGNLALYEVNNYILDEKFIKNCEVYLVLTSV